MKKPFIVFLIFFSVTLFAMTKKDFLIHLDTVIKNFNNIIAKRGPVAQNEDVFVYHVSFKDNVLTYYSFMVLSPKYSMFTKIKKNIKEIKKLTLNTQKNALCSNPNTRKMLYDYNITFRYKYNLNSKNGSYLFSTAIDKESYKKNK